MHGVLDTAIHSLLSSGTKAMQWMQTSVMSVSFAVSTTSLYIAPVSIEITDVHNNKQDVAVLKPGVETLNDQFERDLGQSEKFQKYLERDDEDGFFNIASERAKTRLARNSNSARTVSSVASSSPTNAAIARSFSSASTQNMNNARRVSRSGNRSSNRSGVRTRSRGSRSSSGDTSPPRTASKPKASNDPKALSPAGESPPASPQLPNTSAPVVPQIEEEKSPKKFNDPVVADEELVDEESIEEEFDEETAEEELEEEIEEEIAEEPTPTPTPEPINNAPIVAALNANDVFLNQEQLIALPYSDDEGDLAISCQVSNLSNVSESTPCSCTNSSCEVGVTGLANYSGPASFDFSVSTAEGTSNTATVSYSIHGECTTGLIRLIRASGEESVFATIQEAVTAAAVSGDMVFVGAGSYVELVTVKDKQVHLLTTCDARPGILKLINASGSIIDGFDFNVTGYNRAALSLSNQPSDNVIIRNLKVHGAGDPSVPKHGITITDGDNILIENVEVYNNAKDGVNFSGTQNNLTIRNSSFHSNGKSGVELSAKARDIVITDSSFNNNGQDAAQSRGQGLYRHTNHGAIGEHVTLTNNEFLNNSGDVNVHTSADLGRLAGLIDATTDSGNVTTAGTEGPGVSIAP